MSYFEGKLTKFQIMNCICRIDNYIAYIYNTGKGSCLSICIWLFFFFKVLHDNFPKCSRLIEDFLKEMIMKVLEVFSVINFVLNNSIGIEYE